MLSIFIIVAVDQNNGMGYKGRLPWHLSKELAYFQKVTTQTKDLTKKNMVVMGRATWESLPENARPLSGRINVVLTSNRNFQAKDAKVTHSIEDGLRFGLNNKNIEGVFFIGGAKVFQEALKRDLVDGIYFTRIFKSYMCDTFFPEIPKKFANKEKIGEGSDKGVKFEFWKYGKQVLRRVAS